ncbi:MAG: type secretion protein Rhs [Herbinix sp.]|nr:type secretion protein Rhs [Herbinix sp.]
MQYLRARWYVPSVGLFISEDTYEGDITNPLSLNLYMYVKNNPLRYIDPTGHYDVEGYPTGGPDPNLTYEGVMLNASGYYTGASTGRYHDLLDLVGLIPVIGEFADGANAIAYLIEGERAYAILSSMSLVPILGWSATATKATITTGEAVVDAEKILDKASVFKAACNCFVGGTKVQTDEGEKDIEDIEVGDRFSPRMRIIPMENWLTKK